MNWYKMNKDHIVALIFVLASIILYFIPTGFEKAASRVSEHAKAQVVSIEREDLQTHGMVNMGGQELIVRILNGQQKGRDITVLNHLSGKLDIDEYYKVGDTILVEYQTIADGEMLGFARGHYRLRLEFTLVVLFAVVLILIAGWTGVRAMLSFVFAALIIWKLTVPLFLKGVSPLLVSIIVLLLLTASVSFLVGGLNRRGLSAFLGSCSGLLLACLLALIFSRLFQIQGVVRPFADALLYAGYAKLDFSGIFISGIFIACSGAVMDLAMDIAASMDELMVKKPDIGFVEHVMSGIRIGRSVIGTMTTTLLLAYSGGYTCMMMFYMGQGTPLFQVLNLNYVSAEILNIMLGSFGVISVAPFTALISGIIYHKIPRIKQEKVISGCANDNLD